MRSLTSPERVASRHVMRASPGTAGVIQVPAGTVPAKIRDPADLAEADVAADGMVPLRIVIRAAPTPMQTVGHSHPQARAAASRLSRPRGQRRTPTRHTAPLSRRAGARGRRRRSQCSNTFRSSADSAPHNSSAPRQKHQRHATDDPVGAGAPALARRPSAVPILHCEHHSQFPAVWGTCALVLGPAVSACQARPVCRISAG